MSQRVEASLHGWLVIDKPQGLTSAGVVGRVKRLVKPAKVGHGGALDPLATGVLPIALGEATKTAAYVLTGHKRYRFTVRWGEARDTDDSDGALTESCASRPSRSELEAALSGFRGNIQQVPPTYSAIKVRGRRSYALARAKQAIELEPRPVMIHELDVTETETDTATFELACGKGTYVRALARDLAKILGTLGHVTALRRLSSGPFDEKDAISLDYVEALGHSSALSERVLPVEAALADIPALDLTESEATRLRHGQIVAAPGMGEGTVCAMLSGRVVALAERRLGLLRPVRVFNL